MCFFFIHGLEQSYPITDKKTSLLEPLCSSPWRPVSVERLLYFSCLGGFLSRLLKVESLFRNEEFSEERFAQ